MTPLGTATDASREKLAAWMMANSFATGHGDTIDDLLVELGGQIRELREVSARTRSDTLQEAAEECDRHAKFCKDQALAGGDYDHLMIRSAEAKHNATRIRCLLEAKL